MFTDNDACIIGLTGMSGAGKTTACEAFSECGIDIINCDTVSRIVVEKGKAALSELAAHFGDDIILPDGSLDRRKIGNMIFSSLFSYKKPFFLFSPVSYRRYIIL